MAGEMKPSICIFFVGRRLDGEKLDFDSVMYKVDEE